MRRPTNIKLSKEVRKVVPKTSKIFIDPTIQLGEIIWAKVTYSISGQKSSVDIVYKKPSNGEMFSDYFHSSFKRETGTVVSNIKKIEIIKRTGFEHKGKGYSLGIKSDEKRDSKTGKYD